MLRAIFFGRIHNIFSFLPYRTAATRLQISDRDLHMHLLKLNTLFPVLTLPLRSLPLPLLLLLPTSLNNKDSFVYITVTIPLCG